MAKPKARPPAQIWTRPAPGARRPKLSRDQIAHAALAIADSDGFAEVSMRRVAAELDVGTMTLYYYVKTKDELIALMDDALMGQVLIPAAELPAGWRAGITAIARSSRDVFAHHPWAFHALQGARGGPNGMRHMEQSLAVLADAPFDLEGKFALLAIVDDYVFGHVLRTAEAGNRPMDHKSLGALTRFIEDQLATGEYPRLTEVLGGRDVITTFMTIAQWMGSDTRFEAGLEALLDGMERQRRPGTALALPRRAPLTPPTRPGGRARR